ncbi:hypothetical protein [Nakamurella lactea]|uniref:hypothetical protein n=1 Tax=Nakamurella lactea TaxID=459515 RepID=UPI000417F96D|nr:hypothetical protein [Nakamurella lactea]
MGILDALRGRKSGDDHNNADENAAGGGGQVGPGDPAAPDPTNFQPRTDGSYLAEGSGLRFGNGKVTETDGGPDSTPARVGDYTPTGRFSVSAPFEMLVTFAVTAVGDDYFVARRTSVADRSSVELTYRFRPSAG